MPGLCSTQGPVVGYQGRREMEGATGSGKKEGALIPTAGGICQNLNRSISCPGKLTLVRQERQTICLEDIPLSPGKSKTGPFASSVVEPAAYLE